MKLISIRKEHDSERIKVTKFDDEEIDKVTTNTKTVETNDYTEWILTEEEFNDLKEAMNYFERNYK